MTVVRPSTNDLIRGYSSSHKGYDFSGVDDTETNFSPDCFASMDCKVIQSVNLYVNNWRNTGNLTTRDYGNYVKTKNSDGSFSLYAHLKKDSVPSIGKRLKAGERLATIGNTGNSTGPHLHYEHRNADNINISVQFTEGGLPPSSGDSMGDITIPKSTFEELVTKSSRYDGFAAKGWTNPEQVEQALKERDEALKTLRSERDDARKDLEEYRKKFLDLLGFVAKAVDSRIDETEVRTKLDELERTMTELEDTATAYSKDKLSWAETETELQAEIARLDSLLKQQNVLENSTTEELLREILGRLLKILKIK